MGGKISKAQFWDLSGDQAQEKAELARRLHKNMAGDQTSLRVGEVARIGGNYYRIERDGSSIHLVRYSETNFDVATCDEINWDDTSFRVERDRSRYTIVVDDKRIEFEDGHKFSVGDRRFAFKKGGVPVLTEILDDVVLGEQRNDVYGIRVRVAAKGGNNPRIYVKKTEQEIAADKYSLSLMRQVSVEDATEILRRMIGIRRFEEAVYCLLEDHKVKGASHLYAWSEGAAVGVCSALRDNDVITSTHRGHGHAHAKGAPLDRMLAELMGKETGLCLGRGGSMHLADLDTNNLGATGLVGGFVPVAAGAAYAIALANRKTEAELSAMEPKYRDYFKSLQGRVVVSFFGDGATNTDPFCPSLNFAQAYRVPCVFVCEDNMYGMSVPHEFASGGQSVKHKMSGHIDTIYEVDGQRVLDVREKAREAVEYSRENQEPTALVVRTCREMGHSKSDNRVYRSTELEDQYRMHDSILLLAAGLDGEVVMDFDKTIAVDAEVKEVMAAAIRFAEDSPYPDPKKLHDYVLKG